MAAWRGITRKRGKCAAICACRGLESLQSFPGANGIPDLPLGDTLADFHVAQSMARDQCAYGTSKMEFTSLHAATHLLPKGWDFAKDGPWSCSWCDEVIYTEFGEQLAATTALAALRAQASHGEPAARKETKTELDLKLKLHAELHGDAILFDDLIMTNYSGTKPYIIDPMHCLELNLMKTLWNYSFGDRMTDYDREMVAEYLDEIGVHLDIKARGKRDPGQKWFSAAQADEFVLGDSHYKKSKSPGLVKNILAIIDIIFHKSTLEDSLSATNPLPVAKKPKTARKDRHTAPIAGGYGTTQVEEAGINPSDTSHLSLTALIGESELRDTRESILSYIRNRYGNQAGIVIQILTAWEAFGELLTEWRAKWDARTDPYRAKRALQFARCAREFQRALVSLSNSKQTSWYTHAVVWIVWQQLFFFGNTWPLSTISIESRNARIKKYGLRFTSWRPYAAGATTYSYIDRRSGKHVTADRKYSSSAVHQLLRRVGLAEKGWHTNSRFTAPDKLRLQIQLRSKLLKVDVGDAPPSNLQPATMLSVLSQKV